MKILIARQGSNMSLAWRFAVCLVCALLLTSCGLIERVSSGTQPVEATEAPAGGSPTPASATPLGGGSTTPGGVQITAGPLTVPVDNLGTASGIFWSEGSGGIAVAGENGVAVIQPGQADQQGITPQIQPQAAGAAETTLLTGAQQAPVISWVSGDDQVYALDVSAGGDPVQEAQSDAPVTGLAVSPDGDQVAYATFDGSLTIEPVGDQPGAQAVLTFGLPTWLSSLAYSPDETQIAGADLANFTVYLLDAQNGQVQRTLEWTESPVQSLYFVLFSPDWSRVAWAAQTAVQVMDTVSGQAGPMLNHEDHVTAAAWSPDGRRLATAAAATVEGSLTPAVMVWDSGSGDLLYTFGQPSPVKSLAFSPDGRQVAALGTDGNLQVWNLEP